MGMTREKRLFGVVLGQVIVQDNRFDSLMHPTVILVALINICLNVDTKYTNIILCLLYQLETPTTTGTTMYVWYISYPLLTLFKGSNRKGTDATGSKYI